MENEFWKNLRVNTKATFPSQVLLALNYRSLRLLGEKSNPLEIMEVGVLN